MAPGLPARSQPTGAAICLTLSLTLTLILSLSLTPSLTLTQSLTLTLSLAVTLTLTRCSVRGDRYISPISPLYLP